MKTCAVLNSNLTMPRVLNVAKLEKKFQTLSRSRESIQGLSVWIMNHKDVYQDIVDQWLIAVSKKINTLPMFYVANEVIQGCGKKRCPEFREAFSKVLEKAASFENVKEIKKDVIRLLSLWKERNIYDEEFNQIIEIKLNGASVEELSENEEDEEEEEEELSEIEIIKQFKKENLIDKLESVKSFESEIKEKEDILSYAEVPVMPDLDDIIVRKDCQDMMKKCDKYLALVRDMSELAHKEIKLRKKLLQELNNSCIFYTAQQKDVKEVYNAFRIYGKRVKVMETRLSEKMATLPFVDSPCFSEDNISTSTSNYFSPYDTDASVASKSSPGASPILNDPSQSSSNSNFKQGFSFLGKITKESLGELLESAKQLSEKKSVDESTISEIEKSKVDNIFSSFKEDPPQKHSVFDKQSILSQESTDTENNKEERNISHNESSNCETKLSDLPSKGTDFFELIKTYPEKDTKLIADKDACVSEIDKKSFPDKSTKIPDKEACVLEIDKKSFPDTTEKQDSPCITNLSVQEESKSVFDKSTASVSQARVSDPQEQPQSASNQDSDVDFLLDESYDNKKTKINVSYKRKIEFLLKSKGKKPCSDPSGKESETLVKKESPKLEVDVKLKPERKDDMNRTVIDSIQVEMSQDENMEDLSVKVKSEEDVDSNISLNSSERNIQSTGSLMESLTDNLDHSENSFDGNKSDLGLCLEDSTKQKKNTSSFNLTGTFTGSSLSSLMSGVSTDFLRNILKGNKLKLQNEAEEDCDQKAEVEFNSSEEKTLPNVLADSKTSDIHKEESSRNDERVTLSNSDDYSKSIEITPTSASVKTEPSELPQEKLKLTLLDTNIASHSDVPVELKSAPKLENPSLNVERNEENMPSDGIQDISSRNLSVNYNDGLPNKKPNFLESLQSVLECLSENMLSGCDVKSLPQDSCPELEPPLSIENCMKIYKYLHGDGLPFKTESNLSSTEINSKFKVVSVTPSIEDNTGVVDMECDSEEEV